VAVRSAGTVARSPRSRTAVIAPLVAIWRPTAVALAVPVALRPGPVLPRSPGPVTGSATCRCPSGSAARRSPRTAAELTRGRGPARATELTTGRGPPAAIPNIVTGGGTRGVPARARPAVRRTSSRRAGARRPRRPACTFTIASTARGRAAARLVTRRRASSAAGRARSFGGRRAARPSRPVGRRSSRNPWNPRRRPRGSARGTIAVSPRALTSTTGTSTTRRGLTPPVADRPARSAGLAGTPRGRLPATRTATARCPTIRHAYQPPALTIPRQAKRAAQPDRERPSSNMSGGVLLSHAVPRAVPSALKGLTSGFGMGPGVSPSL
jgi:hypothetical protein